MAVEDELTLIAWLRHLLSTLRVLLCSSMLHRDRMLWSWQIVLENYPSLLNGSIAVHTSHRNSYCIIDYSSCCPVAFPCRPTALWCKRCQSTSQFCNLCDTARWDIDGKYQGMPSTHKVWIRRRYELEEWSFFASECSIACCLCRRWRRIGRIPRVILQHIAEDWRRNWNHCSMLLCHRCCCSTCLHSSWPSLDRQHSSRSRMPCKDSTAWTGWGCERPALSVGSSPGELAWPPRRDEPFVSCSKKLCDLVSYEHSFLKI